MRKLLKSLFCLSMCISLTACTSNDEPEVKDTLFTAGTYTGVGQGINGDIEVEVTVTDSTIESVTIKNHNETAGISDSAIEKIPGRIIESQSLAVDTVSGATLTSNGILEAVENALTDVTTDMEVLKTAKTEVIEKENITLECDVVIVGAGGAGLSAAATAMENGATVIVLEKLDEIGGSTKLAGGAILAGGTIYQNEIGFKDSPEAVAEYWITDEARDSLIESNYPDVDRINEMCE